MIVVFSQLSLLLFVRAPDACALRDLIKVVRGLVFLSLRGILGFSRGHVQGLLLLVVIQRLLIQVDIFRASFLYTCLDRLRSCLIY